jgi:hypothetical protein
LVHATHPPQRLLHDLPLGQGQPVL